jgi:hypothetical protein
MGIIVGATAADCLNLVQIRFEPHFFSTRLRNWRLRYLTSSQAIRNERRSPTIAY